MPTREDVRTALTEQCKTMEDFKRITGPSNIGVVDGGWKTDEERLHHNFENACDRFDRDPNKKIRLLRCLHLDSTEEEQLLHVRKALRISKWAIIIAVVSILVALITLIL